MQANWITTLVAVSLLVFASGCESDSGEARAVLDEFVEAAQDEDLVRVCELWSEWAKRDAFSWFGAFDMRDEPCETTIGTIPSNASLSLTPEVESNSSIDEVTTSEDAHEYEIEDVDGTVEIRRFDGEWRLNSLCVSNSCMPVSEEPATEVPFAE